MGHTQQFIGLTTLARTVSTLQSTQTTDGSATQPYRGMTQTIDKESKDSQYQMSQGCAKEYGEGSQPISVTGSRKRQVSQPVLSE